MLNIYKLEILNNAISMNKICNENAPAIFFELFQKGVSNMCCKIPKASLIQNSNQCVNQWVCYYIIFVSEIQTTYCIHLLYKGENLLRDLVM